MGLQLDTAGSQRSCKAALRATVYWAYIHLASVSYLPRTGYTVQPSNSRQRDQSPVSEMLGQGDLREEAKAVLTGRGM